MPDPANAVLSSWSLPIGPATAVLLSFIFYLRGWIRLQFKVPHRFPVWRLLSFTAGLRTVYLAIASTLEQVAKWRRRYLRGGLGALQDEPRSSRKGKISTELLRQIVDQATRPPQGRARWTCRAMARELGVSKATVQQSKAAILYNLAGERRNSVEVLENAPTLT